MSPIFFIVVIILSTTAVSLIRLNRLRTFCLRRCQGRDWQATFPDATKQEIRDFLQAFIESFVVPQKLMLRINPEDKPNDIYKSNSVGVDSFEYETFTKWLQERYGGGLPDEIDNTWTLGQIFEHVRTKP